MLSPPVCHFGSLNAINIRFALAGFLSACKGSQCNKRGQIILNTNIHNVFWILNSLYFWKRSEALEPGIPNQNEVGTKEFPVVVTD